MFGSPTNYTLPIVTSVLLHGLLVAWLALGWAPQEKPRQPVKPRYIDAKLLQLKAPEIQARPEVKQPQQQPKPKPRVDDSAKKAEQQRQEQVRKERERQQKLKAEADKRKAEQARKEELARQEKARQEALRKQQEADAAAKALANQLAAEAAAQEAEIVGSYDDYVIGMIASNWSRPPSARRDMEVDLEILLGSAGRVTGVKVIKSSGNPAFDRSAEQAVLKVGQFSRLKELDPLVYQREFRRKIIRFRPDDLRM
jgi:colicin import membrane protein